MGASKRKDYVGTSSVLRILLNTVLAGDTVTINGLVYIGVSGVKADNTEFSVDTSDAAAATDLADSISNDARTGSIADAVLTASATDETITVSATSSQPQAISAYSSGATIELSGEFFTLLGLTSNPSDNNEVIKRVNFMNTPFSVQQTGADLIPGRLLKIDTETNFNNLAVRDRVLNGNKEGWVDAITASTSLTFAYYDLSKTKQTVVLTMAQVIASGSLFFMNEDI